MKITATKLKMTQVWKDDKVIPVSVVKVTGDTPEEFVVGVKVKVVGVTKGKGFQGVVKRHGFHGGPRTHGQKNRYRAPGSIGNTSPQRVIPGRRMAGRMGGDRLTLKNVLVVDLNREKKEMSLKGPLPGNNRDRVEIFI